MASKRYDNEVLLSYHAHGIEVLSSYCVQMLGCFLLQVYAIKSGC